MKAGDSHSGYLELNPLNGGPHLHLRPAVIVTPEGREVKRGDKLGPHACPRPPPAGQRLSAWGGCASTKIPPTANDMKATSEVSADLWLRLSIEMLVSLVPGLESRPFVSLKLRDWQYWKFVWRSSLVTLITLVRSPEP